MQGPTLAATGTATRSETPPQATGSATVATTYPDATIALDGALTPWLANDRWTRCEIYLNGERLSGITGGVEITETEGSPIQEASFTVVDDRGAYMHDESFAYGAPGVEIWMTSGTEDGRSNLLMFEGNLEAASNDDAYTPRTAIRASSLSRSWGDRGINQGILSVPAFAGYTWGELIQLYAASACTPLTDFRGELGDEVYSSFDISGMSLVDLIQQWAPLIGIYLRETDGTLELVPERLVVGDEASSAYLFEPTNYLSIREEVPARPTTAITASAVIPDVDENGIPSSTLPETKVDIVREVSDAGVTTETTTTTSWKTIRFYSGLWNEGAVAYQPAAIRTIEEVTYSDTDPYGEIAEFGWKPIRHVITEDAYLGIEQISYVPQPMTSPREVVTIIPTAQLMRTRQRVGAYYAALTSIDYVGGVVFSDGSHRMGDPGYPDPREGYCIEDTKTTYTYRQSTTLGGECKLYSQFMTRSAYGSRLDPAGEQWDDGTYRGPNNYETFGVVEEQLEIWGDNADDLNRSEPYSTSHTLEHKAWVSTGSTDVGGEIRPEATFIIDHREAEYRTAIDANRYEELSINGGITKKLTVEGSIPEVPTSNPEVPASTESAVVVTGSSMRNIYPFSRESVSLQDAQRVSEIYRYIRRKLRESLAVKYVISHPAVPVLRVFDAVTVTDPARQLDEQQGYISAIRRSFDLTNGWIGQETTVAVTPPELDPV